MTASRRYLRLSLSVPEQFRAETQRAQRSYEPRRPFMALRKRQPDARRFRFDNRTSPSASLRESKEIRRDGVGRAFGSDTRRVGKECGSPCRDWWEEETIKKKTIK